MHPFRWASVLLLIPAACAARCRLVAQNNADAEVHIPDSTPNSTAGPTDNSTSPLTPLNPNPTQSLAPFNYGRDAVRGVNLCVTPFFPSFYSQ